MYSLEILLKKILHRREIEYEKLKNIPAPDNVLDIFDRMQKGNGFRRRTDSDLLS